MALNPALRELVATAAAKHPRANESAVIELPASHLTAKLIELALERATKADLLSIIRATLAREAIG